MLACRPRSRGSAGRPRPPRRCPRSQPRGWRPQIGGADPAGADRGLRGRRARRRSRWGTASRGRLHAPASTATVTRTAAQVRGRRIIDLLLRASRIAPQPGSGRAPIHLFVRIAAAGPGAEATSRCAWVAAAFLYHPRRCSNGPRCPRGRVSSALGSRAHARSPSPRMSWPDRASRPTPRPVSRTSWNTSRSRARRRTRRHDRSARPSKGSAAPSTPRPIASPRSIGCACPGARPPAPWMCSGS